MNNGYPTENIVLMGYSIGTGPCIQIAAELSQRGAEPGALITIAAFSSVRDIVQDMKGSRMLQILAPIVLMERWNSLSSVTHVTCPYLLIHGAKDKLIPCKHSERLHELCGSQEKILHICSNADHTKFKEPQDTIDPIGTFLRAHFKPIPCRRPILDLNKYQCPKSVFQKYYELHPDEAPIEDYDECPSAKIVVNNDQAENVGCWDARPVLNWFVETTNAITGVISNVAEKTVDAAGNGVQQQIYEEASINNNNNNNSSKDSGMIRTKNPMLEEKQSNNTNNFSIKTTKNNEAKLKINSTQLNYAIDPIISLYFESFNSSDIQTILLCFISSIVAVYPNNRFNWTTVKQAKEKYEHIFKNSNDDISVNYVVRTCCQEGSVTTTKLSCDYKNTTNPYCYYPTMEIATENHKIVFMSFK